MLNKLILSISALILLCSHPSQGEPTSIGQRIEIKSNVLNETRALQVLLPEGYYGNPESTYPVIYLLDGDYNFHAMSGMLDLLSNKGQVIPDVILVGIADKGTEQYRRYMTPENLTADKEKDNGKASQFLRFITDDLKPYVNKHYRAADNAMLVGHSMGGLFILNALLRAPEQFEHFVAISPSVWLHNNAFTKQAGALLEKVDHKPVSLYLSLGDEQQMGQYRFIDLLDQLKPDNILWQFKHYPDENHNSVGVISLRNTLKDLYKDWYISETAMQRMAAGNNVADVVIKHYQEQLKRHNMNQAIPGASVKAVIRDYYRRKDSESLPKLLSRIQTELPASEQAFLLTWAAYANHFDSAKAALNILLPNEQRFKDSIEYIKAIATKYEGQGDNAKANEYYGKAMKLAKAQQANQWQFNIIEAKLTVTRL